MGDLSDISLGAPIKAAVALSATSALVTSLFVHGTHSPRRLLGDSARDEAVRERIVLRSLMGAP